MYKLSYADIKIKNIGLLARQAKSVLSQCRLFFLLRVAIMLNVVFFHPVQNV